MTAQAAQAEIALLIAPRMLLGDNVIDLMRQDGCLLRQSTILAILLRSTPYPRSLLRS